MKFFINILLLLSFVSGALAEEAPKPYLIYLVLWREPTDIEQGFKEYFSINNIPVQFKELNATQNSALFPSFIKKIKADKPDLVFSWGTSVTLGLVGKYDLPPEEKANFINDIPVIFTLVSYPKASQITPDDKFSGRNVTGTSHLASLETQINAIKLYKNDLKTLGIVYNPLEYNSLENLNELRILAKKEGLTLIEKKVPLDTDAKQIKPIPEMIPSLIDELASQVDFLYLGPDSFVAGNNAELTTLSALWLNLPTFTSTEASIKNSFATIGLVSAYKTLGQFTAFKAEEILVNGKKPSEVPIQTLDSFAYIVNVPVVYALSYVPPLALVGDSVTEDRLETQAMAEQVLQFKEQQWQQPLFSVSSIPLD